MYATFPKRLRHDSLRLGTGKATQVRGISYRSFTQGCRPSIPYTGAAVQCTVAVRCTDARDRMCRRGGSLSTEPSDLRDARVRMHCDFVLGHGLRQSGSVLWRSFRRSLMKYSGGSRLSKKAYRRHTLVLKRRGNHVQCIADDASDSFTVFSLDQTAKHVKLLLTGCRGLLLLLGWRILTGHTPWLAPTGSSAGLGGSRSGCGSSGRCAISRASRSRRPWPSVSL